MILITALVISCTNADDSAITVAGLYAERRSDVMVEGVGEVVKVLPDDTKGSQHQRLIVRLDAGLTVLIAHNIDLAPRINGIRRGDRLAFYGEYEWNEKGGVIHWTHHAPRGDHEDGWLEYQGKRYD